MAIMKEMERTSRSHPKNVPEEPEENHYRHLLR